MCTGCEQVDLERKVIRIPKAKAGARKQPITARLADDLRTYIASLPDGSTWLFPSTRSKSLHTVDIRESFRHAVRHAELHSNEMVPQTLRHTAITHRVQAGVDLPTVQRISGHKTLIMVTRYAHQNGEHVQAATDKLEERYRQSG